VQNFWNDPRSYSYNKTELIQWNDNTPAKSSQHNGISADKTVVTNNCSNNNYVIKKYQKFLNAKKTTNVT
jgi:hypothetical protein